MRYRTRCWTFVPKQKFADPITPTMIVDPMHNPGIIKTSEFNGTVTISTAGIKNQGPKIDNIRDATGKHFPEQNVSEFNNIRVVKDPTTKVKDERANDNSGVKNNTGTKKDDGTRKNDGGYKNNDGTRKNDDNTKTNNDTKKDDSNKRTDGNKKNDGNVKKYDPPPSYDPPKQDPPTQKQDPPKQNQPTQKQDPPKQNPPTQKQDPPKQDTKQDDGNKQDGKRK